MDTVESPARTNALVAVLAFAGIVASLMQTLVVPLIGAMPRLLGTTPSNASWVVTATLLAAAVSTPVAGRLADLYGKRRMLLVLIAPLILGSIVCALATSVVPMIGGRALQGLSTGMVPLAISLLHDVLPPHRVGTAIALMSSSMGIGGALGLPVAAVVAEYTNWRMLFWGTAIVSVAVAVLIRQVVPATNALPRTGRFDAVGAVGLGVGLVCLLLAVSKGGDWGWSSATTVGSFVAAVVVLLAWGWWELRSRHALVDLRVTAQPRVLLTNVASLVVGFAMYAQSLIIPQIMQLPRETGHGLGQSMLQMGLWMAPSGLAMMALSPVGARLSAARGPKTTLVAGSAIMAVAYALATLLMGSTWGLMIAACVSSAGLGFAFGAMPALVMGSVPESETASANAFNSLMRSIGTSVSAAVVGVVLAQMVMPFGEHAVTTAAGFRTGLLIGCGVALVAAAISLVIPVGAPTRDAEESPVPAETAVA